MKDEDYEKYEQNVINAIIQFNTLFADYVKSVDEDLWKRAVDYAKDYAESGNVSFNYVTEKSPEHILSSTLTQTIFLRDVALDIEDVRDEYMKFIDKYRNKPTEEIQQLWLKFHDATPDDPFGYAEDLELFMRCNHTFNFAEFDEEDWMNYANLSIHCTKNREFQQKFVDVLTDNKMSDSKLYAYYVNAMQNIEYIMDGGIPDEMINDEEEDDEEDLGSR